eukprot:TRINITY_DN33122_c0_g1_i5.p1 TRINITY_DN33122_c0_g1~~TRINITY_DN33122_c0_g1_i5.p1  ORF type:complete len:335 (-),score=-34.23 TRINITY_DN33122_c0_g1_i5:18-1022(-)
MQTNIRKLGQNKYTQQIYNRLDKTFFKIYVKLTIPLKISTCSSIMIYIFLLIKFYIKIPKNFLQNDQQIANLGKLFWDKFSFTTTFKGYQSKQKNNLGKNSIHISNVHEMLKPKHSICLHSQFVSVINIRSSITQFLSKQIILVPKFYINCLIPIFLCGISVLKNLDNTERSLYLLNFVFHMAKELLSLFDKYNTYLPNTQKQTAKKFGKSMEISVQIFLVTSILVINTILLTYNRNTIYTVQVLLVGHLQIGNLSNIKFWVRMFQQKFSHCKRGSLKFQTVSGEFCILQSLIQYRNFHNNIISQFSSFQFCIHLIDIKFLTIKLICVQIKQMI